MTARTAVYSPSFLYAVFCFTVSARCPDTSEVILDQSCQRHHNETCSYTCKTGYKSTDTFEHKNVTCGTSSVWDKPLSSLCEKIKCPATIPHGNISTICSREYNTNCRYYYCDSGYPHPSDWPALTCNSRGQWEWEWMQSSTRSFCLNEGDLCPGVIRNGSFGIGCNRKEGDMCSFSCDGGCKRNFNILLTCHNKTWDFDTDRLCTDCVKCNRTIPNGSINMGSCYARQNCSYSCDNDLKYVKNKNITSLTCSNATNGWVLSSPSFDLSAENDLCLARRCTTYIPNGHLLSSCSAEVGSTCSYKCDVDYFGNASKIECQSRLRYKLNEYPLQTEIVTYWSVDEQQLCTNSKQCPLDWIPYGLLDRTCRRNPGDICLYTCEYGYHPSKQTTVTCTSSSTWDASFSGLCEKIVCPSTIPNGDVSSYSRNYNDHSYSYSCNSGYEPSVDHASLRCNYEGQWEWINPSPLKFCLGEEELCPSNIHGGWISYDCRRTEGSICTYYCSECKSATAPNLLTCQNKTWDSNTDHLCTQCTTTTTPVRCPSHVPGGRVYASCDRTPLSTCGAICDYGCTDQLYSLWCSRNGEWIGGESACTCTTCQSYVHNGYISGASYGVGPCDFKAGSTCNVKCNEGCTAGVYTAYCDATGRWSTADVVCDCSDVSNTRTITIVVSILGVIVFLAIVAGVCKSCHRWLSQRPTQRNMVGQSGFQEAPFHITSPTNNSQRTCENTPSNFINAGPPLYTELSFTKLDQTEPPPPYEDVSSQPKK